MTTKLLMFYVKKCGSERKLGFVPRTSFLLVPNLVLRVEFYFCVLFFLKPAVSRSLIIARRNVGNSCQFSFRGSIRRLCLETFSISNVLTYFVVISN